MSKPNNEFSYEQFCFNPTIDDFNETLEKAKNLRDLALNFSREQLGEIEFYQSETDLVNDNLRIEASINFFYQELDGEKINQKIIIKNNPPITRENGLDACSSIAPYRGIIDDEEVEKAVEIKSVIFRSTKNNKEAVNATVGFPDAKLLKSHTKLCNISQFSKGLVIPFTTNPGTYCFFPDLSAENITIHESFTKNHEGVTHASNNCGSRFLGVVAPIDVYFDLAELMKNNFSDLKKPFSFVTDLKLTKTKKFAVFSLEEKPSSKVYNPQILTEKINNAGNFIS